MNLILKKYSNGIFLFSSLLFIISVLALGYTTHQKEFLQIFIFASFAFLGYLSLGFLNSPSLKAILIIGLIVRAALIFSFPNLSDDIFRFVWDGHLTANGLNPYGYLPSDIVSQNIPNLNHTLYDEMNSPNYFTIYPPFTQLIFYISTLLDIGPWHGIRLSTVIIKIIFFVAEVFTFIGIVKLLESLHYNKKLVAVYFLNPLVIIEGMGNLHFEILMVNFLVWSIYYLFVRSNIRLGSAFLVFSIASKLLPLMFLPYFLFRLKSNNRIRFFTWVTILLVLIFSPIAFGLDFANFGASIDLYFQKFEFNASIYYLLRYIGKAISGYNLIYYLGPILGIGVVLSIIKKAKKNKKYETIDFINFAFFSFSLYLFTATTVHPWYLIIPILLSVFVPWKFAIIWSFLILISYINYSYSPYYENLWVVAIEYFLVFGFLYYEYRYPSRNLTIR
ncbi:MAG: hypothetical protein V3V14_06985 [Saprospiraceae bacterium]